MVTLGPALKEWQEKDMEHLRYEYDLKPDDIVLDIGSYRREFADEIKRRYGCYVECFDALDNRAAWLQEGQIAMGGQYYYTSLYDEQSPKSVYKCVDIKPFIQHEIGLCKVNIEGMEYMLLEYMIGNGLGKNVKNLQVQFHLIEGQPSEYEYEKIAALLSLTHELTWRIPFVWENWRRKDGQ